MGDNARLYYECLRSLIRPNTAWKQIGDFKYVWVRGFANSDEWIEYVPGESHESALSRLR